MRLSLRVEDNGRGETSGKKKKPFLFQLTSIQRLVRWRRCSRSEKSYHPCSPVGMFLIQPMNQSTVARLMSADRKPKTKALLTFCICVCKDMLMRCMFGLIDLMRPNENYPPRRCLHRSQWASIKTREVNTSPGSKGTLMCVLLNSVPTWCSRVQAFWELCLSAFLGANINAKLIVNMKLQPLSLVSDSFTATS